MTLGISEGVDETLDRAVRSSCRLGKDLDPHALFHDTRELAGRDSVVECGDCCVGDRLDLL